MAQHLAECFVDLSGECPTPQALAELTLDHVKGRFDVGSLVVVLQKLRTIERVKVVHACPVLTSRHSYRENPASRIRLAPSCL